MQPQSTLTAYPDYGTKEPASLESTYVKKEETACECCWQGRKLINFLHNSSLAHARKKTTQ
ncbi:MAG: hypothetical protein JSR46_08730 [Verrucomicrobia bacterium]|nr:hypothetical protein [Verrucomicrobiota bacterium]